MWIFIAYLVSGLRDGRIEIVFTAVIILATAAVLVLYAIGERARRLHVRHAECTGSVQGPRTPMHAVTPGRQRGGRPSR
jgi:hypothetical protein